ncbi:MAG: hypothetical protein IH991_21490, partial [Planctomycetes bacterium]|nr:hypothetical protein [Planctomycetota bacterium]
MNRPRLILADDHRIFLDGLIKLLESEYEIVATVMDGRSLVSTAQEKEPDADAVLRDFADALQEQQDVGDDATGEEPSVEQPATGATIRIRFDNKKGILVLEGAHTAIEGAEDLIKEIK